MEEEQKELGFADVMKELAKIMESLQKILPTQTEPQNETETESETEPTPAPQPKPEKEDEPTETETDNDEKTEVGDAEEIDKILKDC